MHIHRVYVRTCYQSSIIEVRCVAVFLLFIVGSDEMRLRGLSEPIVRGLKTDV